MERMPLLNLEIGAWIVLATYLAGMIALDFAAHSAQRVTMLSETRETELSPGSEATAP